MGHMIWLILLIFLVWQVFYSSAAGNYRYRIGSDQCESAWWKVQTWTWNYSRRNWSNRIWRIHWYWKIFYDQRKETGSRQAFTAKRAQVGFNSQINCGASSRWSSTLYHSMWKSDQMTIEKIHPALHLWVPNQNSDEYSDEYFRFKKSEFRKIFVTLK